MRFFSCVLKTLANLELFALLLTGDVRCLLSAGTLYLAAKTFEAMADDTDEDEEESERPTLARRAV